MDICSVDWLEADGLCNMFGRRMALLAALILALLVSESNISATDMPVAATRPPKDFTNLFSGEFFSPQSLLLLHTTPLLP